MNVRKQQLSWLITLSVAMLLYFGFHQVRATLPHGIFRGSFPSFLAPIVLFSIVELQSDIRFHSAVKKFAILFATCAISALWFELLVPMFYKKSVREIYDVYAIFGGFGVYWCLQMIISPGKAPANNAVNRSGEVRRF